MEYEEKKRKAELIQRELEFLKEIKKAYNL